MKKKVRLLPHQIKPLEYIIARCRKQHGLILNHYMGTGKTITGIVFLKNFPRDKKVIILPKGLESIWISEAKKLKLDTDNIKFITFVELNEDFEKYIEYIKDSVCVVDEAHNLYNTINNLQDLFEYKAVNKDKAENKKPINHKLIKFIDTLYSTKKILLLSGTIVQYTNISDIRWLVNIAAGKEEAVVPFDENDFNNIFLKIPHIEKVWSKVFKPFLKLNPFYLFPTDFVKKIALNADNVMDLVIAIVSSKIFSNALFSASETKIIESKKGMFELERYKDILMNIKKVLDYKTILKLLFITILTNGIKLVFKYIKNFYKEQYNYDSLDISKLKKYKVDRYFSYFNYKYIKTPDYPIAIEIHKQVKYSPEQLVLLIKLISLPESIANKDLVDLEIYNNIREAEMYKNLYDVNNAYVNKGRIIGNLYDEPEKFKEILKIFRENNKQQTVVYSNFYNSGILLFSKFLTKNNIKHTIYDHSLDQKQRENTLEMFKNKSINMLLLHPDFYEGLSIPGCKHFHILEPVMGLSKKEQLYARVIRYKSHSFLPEKERKVKIYEWSCTLLYDLNKIAQAKTFFNEWLNLGDVNIARSILDIVMTFKEQLSPDDHLSSFSRTVKNYTEEFNKTIQAISIDEKSSIPLECCIWTPDRSCNNRTLKSCLAPDTPLATISKRITAKPLAPITKSTTIKRTVARNSVTRGTSRSSNKNNFARSSLKKTF
jgi:hypothetical protein